MLTKTVVVILDGLSLSSAKSHMGYLNHLVEKEIFKFRTVKSELPSMSRPLYETILTGVAPFESGITNNMVNRKSDNQSIFHLVKQAGGVSCAAAYHWISELYNSSPFNYMTDTFQDNIDNPIQYGRFYFEDSYPDNHLFLDAQHLLCRYNPDFLYIHPMNIDDAGHNFGENSEQHIKKVIENDVILSNFIPQWIQLGYNIIVTSDHGMTEHKMHGGTSDLERLVPLFYYDPNGVINLPNEVIPQLKVAPIICKLLNVTPSDKMEDL